MSEVYRRSMGQTYDDARLRREIDAGTAGYDTTPEEHYYDDLSFSVTDTGDQDRTYALALVAQEVDNVELEYEAARLAFERTVEQQVSADYVELIAHSITTDYDRRRQEGQPVSDEFYQEARDTAEAIIVAHPEYDAEQFMAAAEALIRLQYAERKLQTVERDYLELAA